MENICNKQELFKDRTFYCPICESHHQESEYLKENFLNEKTRWLANMVTHYRHYHITSWNKCWGRNGYNYRAYWFTDYDDEKRKVNERAKRQIFRLSIQFIKENNIGLENLLELQNSEDKTIEIANKLLTNKKK